MSNLILKEVEYKRHWDILESDDFKTVTEEKVEDVRRWVRSMSQVVQHIESGRFFDIGWEEPNSETSEGSESDDYSWFEVVPKEVTKIVYVPLKSK